MSLIDLPYTLFIWPVRVIIEFLFVLFARIFYDPGMAVIILSVMLNTLLLPVYAVAETWQREERELQNRMKKKLSEIRAVFKGDERQMMISAYYRVMGYSPLSALKSSMGLLLQIPFFFAAYQFLAHTSSLSGESFWFLADLGRGDALLAIGGFSVNIMPILMTAVNILSSLVYTRGLGKREKAQLYGMALLFLVILYNSPSGLVLYWTMNNLYSLGKNIVMATLEKTGKKNLAGLAPQGFISALAFLFMLAVLFDIVDVDRYKYLFSGLALAVIVAPFGFKALLAFFGKRNLDPKECAFLYFSSWTVLFLLLGLVIPARTVSSSVSDFNGPWAFILRTGVESAAFCVLIPLLIWAFASPALRKLLSFGSSAAAILALICLFVLSGSYGAMTNSFKIEDTALLVNAFPLSFNILALLACLVLPVIFLFAGKTKIFYTVIQAVSLALVALAAIDFVTLAGEEKVLRGLESGVRPGGTAGQTETVFPYTRKGRNNAIVFLDRATGIALFKAMEKMPGLDTDLDGFVFYPNTLSFGQATIVGLPPLMGGYDYTPDKINARLDASLKDKVNEALTLLPALFGRSGYRVSITDPTMTNLQLVPDISVFSGLENVTARNIDGRMNQRFMEEFPQEGEKFIESFDFDVLFRYGFFRIALPALRYGIHYKGQWWRDGASNNYGHAVTEYASLYYLSDFCGIDDGGDTLNIFMNETTHEPGAYTSDLLPKPGIIRYSGAEIDEFGTEDSAAYTYTFMAAMKAVVKWLDFLKQEGVYDNTRIIIVSDHGSSSFYNTLFEDRGITAHNPLLLVKERESRGALSVSEEFMTNADVPSLVGADLDAPRNPWLGTPLSGEAKKGSLTIGSEVSFQPRRHGPVRFNFTATREFTGGNIFSASSWGPWKSE
ncbi:MAG: membrane protein insertase YidC [Spirochaetaceae bacterium]|jgi:YidC/Oxa1 family membrane protein insertase|nr:membrane protein insertase YidC [Spirochaetaceae bacterium]